MLFGNNVSLLIKPNTGSIGLFLQKEDQRAIEELQAGVHIESKVASIAYKVGRSFQGKGYATEGVTAMIEHLKSKLWCRSNQSMDRYPQSTFH